MKALLVSAVITAAVAGQSGDPVVHLSKEPRHAVVFDRGKIRVQDVQLPAGDTSLYHVHDHALLYVPISSSRVRTQVLGGEWGGGGTATAPGRGRATIVSPIDRANAPARVTSTTSYVDTPLTHRISNIGDTLYRLIAIGNLSKGTDGDSDDLSGLGTPELVNRYYRAFRVSLAPGASTAPHKHAWPVVVVQQTAGRLDVQGSSDVVTTTSAGAFAFDPGAGTHRVKNSGSTATDLVEVELRGGTID